RECGRAGPLKVRVLLVGWCEIITWANETASDVSDVLGHIDRIFVTAGGQLRAGNVGNPRQLQESAAYVTAGLVADVERRTVKITEVSVPVFETVADVGSLALDVVISVEHEPAPRGSLKKLSRSGFTRAYAPRPRELGL